MPEETARDIRYELERVLQSALTDEMVAKASKKFKDACADVECELEYSIQSDLSYNLASWTHRMFEQAVEAMLKGDEESMRRCLHCKEVDDSGRDQNHPVIYGKLFETGAIELRKEIVDAHAELLKSERILDLEDQVKSLVAQVNRLESDNHNFWERSQAHL